MHTKKTNNTNKLMQICYHFALTKIQKLQNLKKNKKIKKTFFVPAGIARNWLVWLVRLVFKPIRNVDFLIPVYIPTGTAGTGMVLTTLIEMASSF